MLTQQYSNRKRKRGKKKPPCVINRSSYENAKRCSPLRLHLFQSVFPLFCSVSGCSHSTVVITVFQGNVQKGSCLGGRSPGLLCILHANRFQKGFQLPWPLLAARGRSNCLPLKPKSVLGCGFKRASQQTIYLITSLFLRCGKSYIPTVPSCMNN